jgi:ADP-ribose pyrophosphatase
LTRPGHVREVTITGRRTAASGIESPFLSLHRLSVRNTFLDGSRGLEFAWDAVLRDQIDAVVLLLVGELDGRECVCLRSCVRPPLLLREELALAVPDARRHDFLWELPAGLLEEGDRGPGGIRRRAAAETLEETGYSVEPDEFRIVRGAPFVSPGVIPERIHYANARIARPTVTSTPLGDGSPAEERAALWWLPIDEGLAMCDRGEIEDMKTELGLRRLAARGVGLQEDAR